MRSAAPSAFRQALLCAAVLGLLVLAAPFPRLQPVLHVLLVLALAPRPGSPLFTVLWAAAGGWVLEASLRLTPRLGGTAWADLTVALFAAWMAGRWPLETLKGWLARLASLLVLHTLLVHGAVRLASGAHPWGWDWLWTGLTLPLWGWAAWRLTHLQPAPRGR
ncbi:hypothetical protein [Geothrix sp. 21YS21S-4]|uniref:hypothetical protein n=1 Tax=Geothrix sp. 21YS21S-4 TaxID=3068889 RepID=UPI0027B895E1|nr:hypothetical protein [Geothrix sp. 21YS21S-4]